MFIHGVFSRFFFFFFFFFLGGGRGGGFGLSSFMLGAKCSSIVRTFARGAMGRRIDPSWGGPIELFLVPASVLRLV